MTSMQVGDHVVEPGEMRRVLGHFASGVTIVTGTHEGNQVGFACQSFTSVSLDPPLVLFCPARTSSTWPRIQQAGRFCVNVLAEDQLELCKAFATSGGDKFEGLAWHETPWGPSLDGVLATVSCDIEQVHPAGDHDVVLGHVRELVTHREVGPLLFFKGAFGASWL
jgi:3-hydroxy-9,10-secoandrosta-1,3,5(10)-triene-9,17-dione monooxygenase reductase component